MRLNGFEDKLEVVRLVIKGCEVLVGSFGAKILVGSILVESWV